MDIFTSRVTVNPVLLFLVNKPPWRNHTPIRDIATTLAELNAQGLNEQTVNDLLTMYVGAASQHVLRMSFVLELEAMTFDTEIIGFWSQLINRNATSPLFHLLLELGGLCVGAAVQRHAAASWRAWQSVLPTLMAATESPDTDTLFTSAPQLRAQLVQLQTTLSQQMNKPAFLPLGPAFFFNTTQKGLVTSIQKHLHKQLIERNATSPISRVILLSQSAPHTGAHLMQPNSEAYEAKDRCFRVFVAGRLKLPHPEARDPHGVAVDGYTCLAPHFHVHSHCTVQTTCVPWRKGPKGSRRIVRQNIHPSTRHVSPCASLYTEHQHKLSLSLTPTSPVFPDLLSTHPFIHCEDPRQDGTSTEFHSSTGYEPKTIELDRILVNPENQIIDDQDNIQEIGVKPLSNSQSLTHSAYDSADEQLRKMLASPLYIREREGNEGQARAYHCERESLMNKSSRNPEISGKLDQEFVQKREANAQRTHAYHSKRESLISSSSRDLGVSGKPDAVFSCHSESSQKMFSERDRSNEPGKRFKNSVHSFFLKFADPSSVGGSLLEGNKGHLLNQARSELLEQEHQVESLNNCIDELQQQAYAQRLELQDAQHGYIESRREEVRLQEELSMK